MNYLELEYQNWERQENYGMYDYSEKNNLKKYQPIVIRTAGKIYRNRESYQLMFVSQYQDILLEGYEPFLRIQVKKGHFFVVNDSKQSQNQPLSFIVSAKRGLKLKEGDLIRMGKSKIEVLRLAWSPKTRGNHYQTTKQPNLTQRPSIFAASFYSQKQKASFLESNPACRYCYSKTIDDQNPFMALCNCSGSTKYIHLSCLVEWVRKRSGIVEGYPKQGIYCVQAKAFTCQVCKSLYRVDRLLRQVFNVDKSKLEEFAAFIVEAQSPLIYVMDLKKQQGATIGRSLENLMVINQLSVSRKHCSLEIDRTKKQLLISDLYSKFGTTIQVKKTEIHHSHDFQKGRTKLKFTLKVKMSFLQKLGICSVKESLRNEHKS